jgi:molecular chaperone GrpE
MTKSETDEKKDENNHTEKEEKSAEQQEQQTKEPVAELTEEEKQKKQTQELQAKVNELNDKYIRLYSEFENFRRRTAKERLELIGTASENAVKEFLPVADDMERAIKANEKIEDPKTIKDGLVLVYNKLKNILEKQGIKEINPFEEDFNLDLHEAITKIPAPDEKLKGKVVDVVEKGYTLNEKIIRYAKVVVGE